MDYYSVITTCNDGELRIYSVKAGNPMGMIEEAKAIDKADYPDKPSDFQNVSIINGESFFDLVWGEVS